MLNIQPRQICKIVQNLFKTRIIDSDLKKKKNYANLNQILQFQIYLFANRAIHKKCLFGIATWKISDPGRRKEIHFLIEVLNKNHNIKQ